MGQAFYRKYRSRNLDEVVGQEHVTKTLKNALKTGKISHAYLLTGPRGVGKTSVARILAYEVNGLPYGDKSARLDIIEIDAASNRRIDEIRDLRDKVHTLPAATKYKVYIIDEIHMLTKEAFNALLKTLEEPPEHVIFILATTEAHKLPETIVSRTQRFAFKPIDVETLQAHLETIAKKERLNIDKDALKLIAHHGDGSFRDSISLLDQLSSHKLKITANDVQSLLGQAPTSFIDYIIDATAAGNVKELLDLLAQARDKGLYAPALAKQISAHLRKQIIEEDTNKLDRKQILKLLKELIEVPASSDPEQSLELTLLGFFLDNTSLDTDRDTLTPENPNTTKPAISKPAAVTDPVTTKATPKSGFSVAMWPRVLDDIKKRKSTLHGILRMSQPHYNKKSNILTLSFRYGFHQKRLDDASNQNILQNAIKSVCGQELDIKTVINKDLNEDLTKKPKITASSKSDKDMPNHADTITTIFGGAEVLES